MINDFVEKPKSIPTEEDIEKQFHIDGVTQEDIVNAIKVCVKVSPLIKPNKIVINTVFSILKTIFIDNKKYVILQAPTGSGKTIIGFITYFCIQYLHYLKNENRHVDSRPIEIEAITYFLTSSKMLQDQINNDIFRFNFHQYISILKGSSNYECYENQIPNKNKDYIFYPDRPCKGLTAAKRAIQYSNCNDICPYRVARAQASIASCAVINYAYILNVMRNYSPDGDEGAFFGKRFLTISDEAHLIPEIVCNIFNTELTKYSINHAQKRVYEIGSILGESRLISELKKDIGIASQFFNMQVSDPSSILSFVTTVEIIYDKICLLVDDITNKDMQQQLMVVLEDLTVILNSKEILSDLILSRPEDLFIESELISDDKMIGQTWKHIIRDLSEPVMVKKHFLKFIDRGLFMSATIGDIDEFAELMGIEKGTYTGLRLPSQFDFEQSPIYLCNSGWLNYANFQSNIDKVLMDTIKVAENSEHLTQKGIIHTSTFEISKRLQETINRLSIDSSRYLFYTDATQKQKMVDLLKLSKFPYVIVGPSLYEGLDLKDDLGRFNILVKVPYAGLTDYTKKKMKRIPFWYKRVTIEKIIQAIGRTNRHKNDYSKVYLMDSLFTKIIWDIPDEDLINRIQKYWV